MKLITCVFLLIVANAAQLFAADIDHMGKLKTLAGGTAIESSPKALAYLRTLTKDEMLTAVRQFGDEREVQLPPERWQEANLSVAILLGSFPEPLKPFDLPAEELKNMRKSKREQLEAGTLPGPLSEQAFGKAIGAITNPEERPFVRYALANYLSNNDLGPTRFLTAAQKQELVKACVKVLDDRSASAVLRMECLNDASGIIENEYTNLLWKDAAVKSLHFPGQAKENRSKLYSAIDSGEVQLAENTRTQLRTWSKIDDGFVKKLSLIEGAAAEPIQLKELAKRYLSFSKIQRLKESNN